jgi:hypothetical protein
LPGTVDLVNTHSAANPIPLLASSLQSPEVHAIDVCQDAGTRNPDTVVSSPPTLIAEASQTGKIKIGPCDCDGTCCATGNTCVGKPGERRCKQN